MRSKQENNSLDWFLLLLWIAIGTGLRFTNLELKPPWADEWATLVFSLGHSFKTIPLEQIIDLDILLQPLQLEPGSSTQDVVTYLMRESTHPPIYFVLTHFWLKLFSQEGLISLSLARSLSVWLGVLGIPTIFALGKLITGLKTVGHIASVLMAVSPYGIYLAQEARHYTLAILWVMASLTCLVITVKSLAVKQSPAIAVIVIWVIVNSLGVATHYFFVLALVAQILVLSGFYWREVKQEKSWYVILFNPRWGRVGWAVLGTIAGCSIWLGTWLDIPDNQLTNWTEYGDPRGKDFLAPVGRLIAWLATMILLLPVEGVALTIVITSGIIVLALFFLLLIAVWKYWHQTSNLGQIYLTKQVNVKYILFSLLLVLGCAYIAEKDITLAARFQFFYFPSFIILIATILSYFWQQTHKNRSLFFSINLMIVTLLIGLAGAITVISDYGYQKPDRPDLVVSAIRQAQNKNPDIPILVSTLHKTHEQTGEMMGIAWEWHKANFSNPSQNPRFLLVHKEPGENGFNTTQSWHRNLDSLPRPLELWVVNFSFPTELENQNCFPDENFKLKSSGYSYSLYHCS